MENQELAKVEQEGGKFSIITSQKSVLVDPNLYMQSKYIVNDLIKDRALPKYIETAGQGVMVLMIGAQMGMNAMEALSSFYIVNGAINIWGKAVPNRLRQHGYDFEFIEEDQTHCKARVWKESENGHKTIIVKQETENEEGEIEIVNVKIKVSELYVEDFKYSDAELSGYTKGSSGLKVGWKEGINRIKKMRYNVLSLIISTYLPDVLGQASGIVEVSEDYVDAEESSKRITKRDKIARAEEILATAKVKEQEESQQQTILVQNGDELESDENGRIVDVKSEILSEKNDRIMDKMIEKSTEIVINENIEQNIPRLINAIEKTPDDNIDETNNFINDIKQKEEALKQPEKQKNDLKSAEQELLNDLL